MKKLVLLSLVTFLFTNVYTQHLPDNKSYSKLFFESLNINQGLSQNTVTCIIQDRKGFMWFGTKDGLNRYDGLSFQVYKKNTNWPTGLRNSFIKQLHEDKNGNIWIGTDAGVYIYNPKYESFSHFNITSNDKGTKIEKSVTRINEDISGNIWIAVESQGLFHYNIENKTLENYILTDAQVSANIACFAYDDKANFWMGSFGDGLYYSQDTLKTVSPFYSSTGEKVFDKDIVTKIAQGPYNYLYVASVRGGLKEINLSTNKVRNLISVDETGEQIYIRDFIFNGQKEIWIGTESGLIIYDIKSGKHTLHRNSKDDPYSLSDNAVYALFKDREGGIWLGSYFGGINYYPHQYTYFDKYYPTNNQNSIQSKRVREFCKGKDGIIWIGTEDGGLNMLDTKTQKIRLYEPSKSFTNIHGLCMDGDNLWIGTFMKGLKVLNTKTGTLKSYRKGNGPNDLNDNNIFAISKTKDGTILLGTLFGLLRYNRKTDGFEQEPLLNGKFVYDIKEDSFGDIWVATYTNGLYRYNISNNKWINYLHDEKDSNSLPYNKVVCVFEDSQHHLWITTQGGGFCRYERKTNSFRRYSTSLNLSNEVIYQIIEDNEGFMWLTGNCGLIRFNPSTEETKVYTTANGLLTDQFNYRSSFKDETGKLYFGTIEGFIAFEPKNFSENKHMPHVTLTDFLIYNKKVPVGSSNSPLLKSITYSDSITLSSSNNSFSIRLAALSFHAPKMNKIMYKLEGFDKEWHNTAESPVVTYSNLSHGSYTFRTKAYNYDGVWSDRETLLYIEILPPFYLTLYAYIIYFTIFVGCFFYLFWSLKKRQIRKQHIQMEKFEQKKEREVYNAKIDFFTNLAHEIRTPLTLIKGPLENVLLKKEHSEEVNENLQIMNNNTDRLLALVNQLLDFRKVEIRGFQLNFIECNISEIIRENYKRFTLLAKQQDLEFKLNLPPADFYAHVDKEAFTKILSNLFNNAIKYSATYVNVTLEVKDVSEKRYFNLKVVNDGLIVPEEYRENIFKPFVQFNQEGATTSRGTGIGLALARSLAELHQGNLRMDNDYERNSFILNLPVFQEFVIKLPFAITSDIADVNEQAETDPNNVSISDNKPLILVVEDNIEMLWFIIKQMRKNYSVLSASNGKKALEILDEHDVRLIISDVVMPEMGGLELCEVVKSDVNYSHIPIILLTAKTNMQSKIEGLESGADAYIEKPFSVGYLLASATNLIQNREKLRQAYANSPFIAANTVALTKADEEFLKKLMEIVEANFHNPDFSMDDMAEKLNMSRSSFYRKIKAVIDLSPNDYLRLERLKKAAQLLKEGEYQVSEICYMAGFNSPSYFSKCFLKQFGVLPKDFSK